MQYSLKILQYINKILKFVLKQILLRNEILISREKYLNKKKKNILCEIPLSSLISILLKKLDNTLSEHN